MNRIFLLAISLALFTLSCKAPTNQHKVVKEESLEVQSPIDSVAHTDKKKEIIPIDYDTTEWAEIVTDESFVTDIRYATNENFMKRKIYNCGRCFVRPHIKKALEKVAKDIASKGYKIILYDCYRPKRFQQALWDIKPDARYVTPPKKGSMHNRGVAIDIGLLHQDGTVVNMGTDYDYFGREAYPANQEVDKEVYQNRQYLKQVMGKAGFSGIRTEWWHFSIKKNAPKISDWIWSCD